MTDPLDAARAMVAAASPGPPWGIVDRNDAGDIYVGPDFYTLIVVGENPLHPESDAEANAQLTTVAVNTWLELVEALDDAGCSEASTGTVSCLEDGREPMCDRCAALADVARELRA